jgi:energy-coupling factor transport system ATP-binding protein
MNIDVTNVSFRYSESDDWVLKDLTCSVQGTGLTLVVGRNGAGKSTLLRLLNGLLKPSHGAVFINGVDTRSATTGLLAKSIVVTFQNPGDQLFAATVENELQYAPSQLGRRNVDELVARASGMFGFTQLLAVHPYDLLPAHRKLLTVASAVSSGSPILAFDEPSAGLSETERILLTAAMHELRHSHTLLVVSHDFPLFLPVCDRILILGEKTLLFNGTVSDFLSQADGFRKRGILLPPSLRMRSLLNLPVVSY